MVMGRVGFLVSFAAMDCIIKSGRSPPFRSGHFHPHGNLSLGAQELTGCSRSFIVII